MACLRPTAIHLLLYYSSGISAESKSEAALADRLCEKGVFTQPVREIQRNFFKALKNGFP